MAAEEEAFVAFVDFLGFSETSRDVDEKKRAKVLALLLELVQLRADFSATSKQNADGSVSHYVQPAISTFSDNIVISYNLKSLREASGDQDISWFLILGPFHNLVAVIAAQALRLGLLIRGGATVGRLYHANGVVFGEALVEAVGLEKSIAIYPRVVLSSAVMAQIKPTLPYVKLGDDGVHAVNYMNTMLFKAAPPGDTWAANLKEWFHEAIAVIQCSLKEHRSRGELGKLSKWTWFAKEFRATIAELQPEVRNAVGISIDNIPWN